MLNLINGNMGQVGCNTQQCEFYRYFKNKLLQTIVNKHKH